jgi:hypothetical protein
MPDYKMLDEIDVLIFGRTTPEDDKHTSEFIKAYKAKHTQQIKSHSLPSRHAKTKTKAKR